VNRLHKTLEDTNLKLSSVLTDIMGQTGRHILGAIIRGEEDPAVLADLALRRAASKRDALALALRGRVSDHHRLLLRELLEMIQHHDQAIYRLDQQIEERLRPYDPLIQQLDVIPGCSRRVIEILLAEVGWDLSAFPDAAHLASWVGICPGNNESGGKRFSGRIRKGNRWCKRYHDRRPHATRKSEPLTQESAMLERKIKRAEEGRCIPWHFEMKFAPGS
jgi:transposase